MGKNCQPTRRCLGGSLLLKDLVFKNKKAWRSKCFSGLFYYCDKKGGFVLKVIHSDPGDHALVTDAKVRRKPFW
jgi:hypothetical protein